MDPPFCRSFRAGAAGACGLWPRSADSGAGVGFQDYDSYIRGAYAPPPAAPAAPAAPPAAFDPTAAAAAIDRAEARHPLPRRRCPAPARQCARRDQGRIGRDGAFQPTISDEQDFAAVAARETIESDAERIARNREQYVVVQPRDLPQRPARPGRTSWNMRWPPRMNRGVQLHRRSSFGARIRRRPASSSPLRTCAAEFLARGGPTGTGWGLTRWRRLCLRLGSASVPACGAVSCPRRIRRKAGRTSPTLVVIHYTAMASCAEARARLCDPVAEVSAHWLIDRDGTTRPWWTRRCAPGTPGRDSGAGRRM